MKVVLMAVIMVVAGLNQANAASLADLFDGSNIEAGNKGFLKVDDAFTVVPSVQNNKLSVSIDITPEHYVYKDKLKLSLPKGMTATPFSFSKGARSIEDPYFGKVAVFDQRQVVATTTLTNMSGTPTTGQATLTWQGCAKAGLCYPPQKEVLPISLPAGSASSSEAKETKNGSDKTISNTASGKAQDTSTAASENQASTLSTPQKSKAKPSEDDNQLKSIPAENSQNANPISDQSNVKEKATSSAAMSGSTLSSKKIEVEQKVGDTPVVANEGQTSESTVIEQDNNNVVNDEPLSSAADGTFASSVANQNDDYQLTNNTLDQDPFGLAKHPWLALALLFLAGLGLALTPCVLPMLPIVSNIIARQHKPTAKKGLILSGSYALGVAVAYGILGAVIAIFGQSLGIIGWLQNPIILSAFAAVFVLLALYMLDIIRFPVPNLLKQKMHAVSESGNRYLGSTLGSFIAGFLSALVVSPCVSAPLFGALLAVSTLGNPLLGFAALFMLGFGLSAPLMLLGVSQGNWMPQAGEWMNWVKQGFALLLLAVALLLIERVLISPVMLVIWSIWFMVVASWAWHWSGRGIIFAKAIAIILALWSAIVLVGAAMGSHDVWQPLGRFNSGSIFSTAGNSDKTINLQASTYPATDIVKGSPDAAQVIVSQNNPKSDLYMTSLDELIPVIKQTDKVLVDVTAEWCVECRIMDKTLFTNRPESLKEWQVVKLDVTKTTANSQRILTELRLFGPPALLYFVDGTLQEQQVGTVSRREFEQTLLSL